MRRKEIYTNNGDFHSNVCLVTCILFQNELMPGQGWWTDSEVTILSGQKVNVFRGTTPRLKTARLTMIRVNMSMLRRTWMSRTMRLMRLRQLSSSS